MFVSEMLCVRRLLKSVPPPVSTSVRTLRTSLQEGARRLGAFSYPLRLVPPLLYVRGVTPIERMFSTNHKEFMKIEFGPFFYCND